MAEISTCSKRILRKAGLADLETLCRFFQNVCNRLNTRINYPLWNWGIYPDESVLHEAIVQEEMVVFCEKERIVGAARISPYLEGMDAFEWTDSRFNCIHLFCIDPDFSGQKLGDVFLGQILSQLKKEGYASARLNLIAGNAPARTLYERAGFHSKGTSEVLLEKEGTLPFELMEYIFPVQNG